MCATKSHSDMLTQVSVEAVYSASYVENYLDCVENLPNDLQRMISRMRELDVNYLVHVRESQKQTELWKSTNPENAVKLKRVFHKLQKALIAAQELGDEKMHLLQSIQDKIENKTRLLDHDFKNLDFGKEEPAATENKEQVPVVTTSNTSTNNVTPTERPNKRARRSRHETFSGLDSNQNDNGQAEHVLRSQVTTTTSNNAVKKNAAAGKKKKRKSRQNNQQREETPPKEEEPSIDHDEPTYCICDQISFGEMIMCDNDLCPIEWFHFSCVSLSTKPKGKWYCPRCRGDRPNAMKPKAQFLKELEKYNKEKEEKT